MKNIIMWDSCTCIRWMRENADEEVEESIPVGSVSTIVAAEILVAAHKHHHAAKRRAHLARFFARMSVVPFDANAAGHYAEIRAHLEKKGTPIGPLDLLIAAHARSLGATLITNNAREFKRVPGLKIIAP